MADKQLVDRSTKFQSSPTETYFVALIIIAIETTCIYGVIPKCLHVNFG